MTNIADTADRWAVAPPPPPPPGASAPRKAKRTKEPLGPVHSDVVSFTNRYIAMITDTRVGGPVSWCPRWWEHPAAVVRLTALWQAWEVLRLRPDGMSAWFTGHYDPHMRALLDGDRGPFSRCLKGHQAPSVLKADQPRETWHPADPITPVN